MKGVDIVGVALIQVVVTHGGVKRDGFHLFLVDAEVTEVLVVGEELRVNHVPGDHHCIWRFPAEQRGDLVLDEVPASGVAQQH